MRRRNIFQKLFLTIRSTQLSSVHVSLKRTGGEGSRAREVMGERVGER